MSRHFRRKISLTLAAFSFACFSAVLGCSQAREPLVAPRTPSRTTESTEGSEVRHKSQHATHGNFVEPSSVSAELSELRSSGEESRRKRPAPSRLNQIGHVVALAGLREPKSSGGLRLLIFDPADNEIARSSSDGGRKSVDQRFVSQPRHDWLASPTNLDVIWGRQRTAVELQEGKFFTVVGAILVHPAVGLARPTTSALAPRMPDLSQNLRPEWPGLCAATAAADILYRIGYRDPAMIGGHPFGPATAADQAAGFLIAGLTPAATLQSDDSPALITAGSLAGRMGNLQGKGATALGIVNGLRSWIADHCGETWRADLAFLDDAPNGRSPAEQLNWFARLGATVNTGGCLLLLWQGVDWADRRVGTQEDRSQDADPRFPPLTSQAIAAPRQAANAGNAPPEHSPADASDASAVKPERPQTAAVTAINQNLEEAQQALASGRHDAARRLAEKVLEAGLPIRFEAPGIEAALDAARAISAEADRDAPKNSRARSGIRTRYDG